MKKLTSDRENPNLQDRNVDKSARAKQRRVYWLLAGKQIENAE
jgi:hypothetical protein